MLDVNVLKEEALASLLGILDSISGKKLLILDRSLSNIVSLVSSYSTLQDHGIEKIIWLQSLDTSDASAFTTGLSSSLIYLTSSSPLAVTLVAQHVESVIHASQNKPQQEVIDLFLVLSPERTLAADTILEDRGVLGDLVIHQWLVQFLPLANDLISLNLPEAGFSDSYLQGLTTGVYRSSQALGDFQTRFGLFGRLVGKGDQSKMLAQSLLRFRDERQTSLASKVNDRPLDLSVSDTFDYLYSGIFLGTNIEQLIIIDRIADPLTPLLTQLTYTGLVDEFYGVSDSGQVDIPTYIVTSSTASASTTGPSSSSNASVSNGTSGTDENIGIPVEDPRSSNTDQKRKVSLHTESDKLYSTLSDLNFSSVGQSLNKVARQLQNDYDQRHEAKTVSQIRDFVGKLGGLQSLHQSLRFHTALAEDLMTKLQEDDFNHILEIQQNLVAETLNINKIHEMIEDLIGQAVDVRAILRLLAIECLCNGGIKEKQLQHFKREILHTYGNRHITTFRRLESLGLIYSKGPKAPDYFRAVIKSLNLISDQQQEDPNSDDISFTYSGYSPLSVRLVQCVVDKSSILGKSRASKILAEAAGGPGHISHKALTGSGWKGAEDLVKMIPGPTIDEVQRTDSNIREGKLRKILTRNGPTAHKSITLVFFLGGITYAEIAALRHVSKRSSTTELLIATTGIINGNNVIDSAIG